ncbi:farnesol dehydrogenase-like [Bacillus rossius redtenbacheri]|uniref:farnesol dehydrogenase-like n=1 Tax=Bacillus rossius redtenbacheri TaxID=93214 RepID=UPI002FDE2157
MVAPRMRAPDVPRSSATFGNARKPSQTLGSLRERSAKVGSARLRSGTFGEFPRVASAGSGHSRNSSPTAVDCVQAGGVVMDRWRGKVAVVTGASAGIGAAVAQALVRHGLKVVGLARSLDKMQAYAEELKGAPGEFHPLKVDMTKEADILAAFQWIKKHLGVVHVLVNNAGVVYEARLLDGPTEQWRAIVETNILGYNICTREAYQIMKEKGVDDGHIINMNSVCGHGMPHNYPFVVYLASKHAITALTDGLRRELTDAGSRIKVTSLSPGTVKTDIMYRNNTTSVDPGKVYSKHPYLTSEDIADSLVYVLSTPPNVQISELTIAPVGEKW